MITGQFQPDLRCLVEVEIMDASGAFRPVHAKLDTGFDGDIALPNSDFQTLDTSSTGTKSVSLADGTVRSVTSCIAKVRLGEIEHDATILNFGDSNQPLIGMEILLGYSIHIDVLPFGDIRIEPIQLN